MAPSGSSQVENGTGRFPCLRREKRSSSAAATVRPSTTRAAAESWNTALMPRTRTLHSRRHGLTPWPYPGPRSQNTYR